ncbi:MAG TPA: serine/threonine-protein kinase [Rubrobacteraceae bacterium]|nr:serine/threonine-protein kinase [Rubrobacteraceae bacterium]
MNRLGGRFALVREIGAGGMSRVYLGRDEILDRPVAVKVLNPNIEDPEAGLRFRREGKTAARLSHPNIVQVYDAGEDELDGREVSYIVMEYLPGGDLKELVVARGPLPEKMLSRIGADVAAGLAHAHGRGVIHRDIKPQNVLIDEYGSPKLSDFGIARAFDAAHSTSTGSYLGTAAYSSPEQLQGGQVTPKCDVYSLGVTLYHAAVGEPPFTGDPLAVASQQVAKEPTPPRARGATIGVALEGLILGCLAKDPADRPNAYTLHERLLQAGVSGAYPTLSGDATRGVRRAERPAKATGVAALKRALSRRRRPELAGPPATTISLPTRTFRAGSRQRNTLAGTLVALLLFLLLAAGAWALLGPAGGGSDGLVERITDPPGNFVGAPGAPEGRQQPADGASGLGTSGGESGEASGPVPPAPEAEDAVFDMYVQQSYQTPETSWAFLSERLQEEISSPEAWAEQEDIYTLTYVYFPTLPQAEVSGDAAEVAFEVRLDRDTGSEMLSGTWICVVEDGEWKLDRLEDEETVPL